MNDAHERDYAVWHTERRLTNAGARSLYEALCEEDTSGVAANPAGDAFSSVSVLIGPLRLLIAWFDQMPSKGHEIIPSARSFSSHEAVPVDEMG